ncbi:MAG: hypothetical protein JNL74_18555, partial [Fibrobacteres bacterium]|nr:hypothetical protein [Fibrobacterota bacterium]
MASGATYNNGNGTISLIGSDNRTLYNGGGVHPINHLHVNGTMNTTITSKFQVSGNVNLVSYNYFYGDTLAVAGNVTGNGAKTGSGDAMILMNGVADQTMSGGGGAYTIPNLTIDKSSGSLNMSDTLHVCASFYYRNGTFNPGNSVLRCMSPSSATLLTGSAHLKHLMIDKEGHFTISGNVYVDGDVHFRQVFTLISGKLSIGGSIYNADVNFGATQSTKLALVGTGVQRIGAISSSDWPDDSLIIDKASGKVILDSTIALGSRLDIVSGVLDMGNSSLTVPNTLTIGSAGRIVNTGTGDLVLGANVTNNGSVYMNSFGGGAGDGDSIWIRSTNTSYRTLTGGTAGWRLYDVKVEYITAGTAMAITSGSSGGHTSGTWGFYETVVPYSVGINTGNVYATGTATANSTLDTITFSGSLDSSMGEGDMLILDADGSGFGPDTVYIRSKPTTSKAALVCPLKFSHSAVDFKIKRAFNDIQTWENARDNDLVTEMVIEKGVCYNDGDFVGTLDINGATTDVYYYMWLTTAEKNRHHGKNDVGVKFDGNFNNTRSLIIVSTPNTIIEGLRITRWSWSSANYNAVLVQQGNVTIRNNIFFRDYTGAHSGNALGYTSNSAGIKVYNNLFHTISYGNCIYDMNNYQNNCKVWNNTCYDVGNGFYVIGGGSPTGCELKNNIFLKVSGSSVGGGGIASYTKSYNISSDAGDGGTGSKASRNAWDVIADTSTAAPDLHISYTSCAKDSGDSVGMSSTFIKDIDDTIRQYSKWDIGADELTLHPYTWVGLGADNNWSTAANWFNGVSAPGASDTAFFTNVSTKRSYVDASYAGTVKSVYISSGYTDSIKLYKKLVISDSLKQSGGTFYCGSYQLVAKQLGLYGGVFSASSDTVFTNNGIDLRGTCSFVHNNGTVFSNGNTKMYADVGEYPELYNYKIATYPSDFNLSGCFNIMGNLNFDNANTFIGDTLAVYGNILNTCEYSFSGTQLAKILIKGASNVTMSAAGNKGNYGTVIIDKSGGQLVVQDSVLVCKNFINLNATVDLSASPHMQFSASDAILTPGSCSYPNVTVAGAGTITLTGNWDINGYLVIALSNGLLGNYNVNVAGNLTNTSSWNVGGQWSIILDGNSNQTISGSYAGVAAAWPNKTFTINKTSGKVLLGANFTLPNALTLTSGVLDQGAAYGLKTGGALTIGASATLINRGTGYDSLGGDVINNGLVFINGGGYSAGDADVMLRSTVDLTARTWSGTGKYFLTDVDVKDQTLSSGTIYMRSSAKTGTCTGFDTTKHIVTPLSIGTSASALFNTGTVSVSAADSIVTFSGVALNTTVGEGDRIIFDVNGSSFGPETCYVKSRDNTTQVTLQLPSPLSFTAEDYEIRRVFNSPGSWESATDRNLVAQKVIYKGVCYNDGVFTTQVLIDGSTCDVNHYRWITVAVGNRHNGNAYSTAGVRMEECGYHAVVDNRDQYTLIEWMQVKACNLGSGISNLGGGSGDVTTVRNCIVYTYSQNSSGNPGIGIYGGASKAYNNLVYGFQAVGILLIAGAWAYNNTVVRSWEKGIESQANSNAKNNIVIGTAANYSGTFASSSYNISTDATASGTGSIASASATSIIRDTAYATFDARLKNGTPAFDAGDSVGLSALYVNDLADTVRHYQAWDIGCREAGYHPMTWVGRGTTQAWNEAANWEGGVAPGVNDTAFFGVQSSKDCSINVAISVKGIKINSGYIGTVRQTAGNAITVGSGGYVQAGGTFIGSNATITVSGNMTLSGGTFTSTSGNLNFGGGAWTSNTGSPTFNANGGTVVFNSSGHQTSSFGTIIFNNFTVTACVTCSETISDSLDIDGTLSLVSHNQLLGGPIKISGNVITTNRTATSGSATLRFDGNTDQTVSASGGLGIIPNVLISKTGGTLFFQDSLKFIGNSSWSYSSGTTDFGTGTILFATASHINIIPGSSMFNNVVFSQCPTCNDVLTGTLDVNGNLTFTDISQINTGAITVAGNVISTDAAIAGTATVTLDGTGNQNIDIGSGDLPNTTLTINKASGNATLLSNMNLTTALTITSGTLAQGTSTYGLKTGGTLTIGAAGAWTNLGTGYDSLGGDVVNSGSITINGNGSTCGDADGIIIHSTVDATQRLWSGTGSVIVADANVKDQGGSAAIRANSSTQGTGVGANWTFVDCEYIWTGAGTDSNWNTAANWSFNSVPGVNDVAYFTDRTNRNCYINANASVKGMRLTSAWVGKVIQESNRTLTVGVGGYTQAGGVFIGGNKKITITDTINVSAGSFTSTSDTLYLARINGNPAIATFANNTFTHNSGVFYSFTAWPRTYSFGNNPVNHFFISGGNNTITGTLDVNGNLHTYNLNAFWTGTVTVAGDYLTEVNTGSMNAIVRLDGSGTQTVSANGYKGRIPNLEIASTGTVVFQDTIVVGGNWTWSSGAVNTGVGSETVEFLVNRTIVAGSKHFNNVIFSTAGSLILTDTMFIDGDFTVTGANSWQNGYIAVAGDIAMNAVPGSTPRTTKLVINGTANQTISQTGDMWMEGGMYITKPSGKITLASNIKYPSAIDIISGELDQSNYGLTVGGALTVAAAGKLTNTGTGYDSLGGNFVNNGTVVINGSGATCGDADAIQIRSIDGVQRSWSGT